MKKIGLLFGIDSEFPTALIEAINKIAPENIIAEEIKIDIVSMTDNCEYDVILDRISDHVPFYKSYLKFAAFKGCKVINNPFWSCADDDFFHAALASKINLPIPKTIIIPSKDIPKNTVPETLHNLNYPLNWEKALDYVGFPAFLKPNTGSGYCTAYKIYNKHEFFSAYDLTGTTTMILQESVEHDEYVRCFVIGKKEVLIMKYNPMKPQHMRYSNEDPLISEKTKNEIIEACIKICDALGFDFNAVEFAVKNGSIFATEFLNSVPKVDLNFMGEIIFTKLTEITARFLVETALLDEKSDTCYRWNKFLTE